MDRTEFQEGLLVRCFNSRISRLRAATLLEFLVALLVWGLVLAGVLPAVWRAIRDSRTLEESVRARTLVEEIEEEIVAMPRMNPRADEDDDSGPSAPMTRSEFESPLDYQGLQEHPPRDPLGNNIAGAGHLTRKVSLSYVDPEDLEPVAAGTSKLIRVTVSVSGDGDTIQSRVFLRSLL